jgi:hypothetical protein
MEDGGEVHVGSLTCLYLADVSPLCVVWTPQVDGVIARRQREPKRLSEMQMLSGDRNGPS